MGCAGGKPVADEERKPPETSSENRGSNRQSQFIRNDAELDGTENGEGGPGRVLLLGAGETGKSTILKQTHLLYGQSGALDMDLFRKWMRRNVVESAKALCKMALEKQIDVR